MACVVLVHAGAKTVEPVLAGYVLAPARPVIPRVVGDQPRLIDGQDAGEDGAGEPHCRPSYRRPTLSFSCTSYNFSYNSIRTLSALYPHLSGQDRRHLYRI